MLVEFFVGFGVSQLLDEVNMCLNKILQFQKSTLVGQEVSYVLGKLPGWVCWGEIPNHLTICLIMTQQPYCSAVLMVMR